MIDFIARYFSSFWSLITAPFRTVWRYIAKIFPERDCTVMDTTTGNVHNYQQSSFWRFTKFCATVTMCIWATWSTYVYVYHRPLLQKRTQQLEQVRNQHNRQMTDLKIYLKKYNDLNRNLNIADDKILKADKNKLSDQEKEDLLNTKSKILGELDFLQTRISEMMDNDEYNPEFDKISEMSLAFELVRNENTLIREQNSKMLESASVIADADNKIVEIVSKMASENISELREHIKRINSSIIKLGLNESKLIEQANKYSNQIIGKSYNSLNLDKSTDSRYKKIAQQLEQWHGLKRLTKILPLGAPVAKKTVTSPFGNRKDPFTGKTKHHKGIDFAGKIGTELYAVAPGRVISAGERSGYGTTVEVDHGLGFTTLYAHLSKVIVSRGDWVRPGTVIGLGGSSGRSTGPHLHYEIRYKGTPFNPTNFVKE